MTLIPYAGKDPTEKPYTPFDKPRAPRYFRPVRAYRLFQNGRDTLEIAAMLHVKEPTIHRWISVERSKSRGLPNPFA